VNYVGTAGVSGYAPWATWMAATPRRSLGVFNREPRLPTGSPAGRTGNLDCRPGQDNNTPPLSLRPQVLIILHVEIVVSPRMNCLKCFHPHQAHEFNKGGDSSLLRVGRCLVPDCECTQYVDKIEKMDEDLL